MPTHDKPLAPAHFKPVEPNEHPNPKPRKDVEEYFNLREIPEHLVRRMASPFEPIRIHVGMIDCPNCSKAHRVTTMRQRDRAALAERLTILLIGAGGHMSDQQMHEIFYQPTDRIEWAYVRKLGGKFDLYNSTTGYWYLEDDHPWVAGEMELQPLDCFDF